MSSPSFSQLPSTTRILRHIVLTGLLAALGFGIGQALFSGANAASIALAVLAALGYVLIRLMMRINRAEAHLVQLRQQLNESSRQAEALTSLAAMINPVRPLPPTRGWAMSPDILCHVASIVLDRKPRVVLEASSGVSTVVIAYCLKQLGSGNVIALEHDERFAAASKQSIHDHGLEEFARVIHAPLATHQVNGVPRQWYDLSEIEAIDEIELLVIDGPPALTDSDHDARFPALPLLYQRLAAQCQIVLDDANREGERQVVQSWLRQFPGLNHQQIPCEKGASILTKDTDAASDLDSD